MARQPSGKGSARESGAPLDDAVDPVAGDDLVGPEVDRTVPAAPATAAGEVDEFDNADADDAEAEDLDAEDLDADDADSDADVADEPAARTRSIATDKFWSRVRVQPVEIALPAGVGFTLRAYRLSNELTPTETEPEEDDFHALQHPGYALPDDDEALSPDEMDEFERSFDEAHADSDEEVLADEVDDDADTDEESDDLDGHRKLAGAETSDDAGDGVTAEADDDPEADEPKPVVEEVPAFLSHRGRLLMFRSAEGLADFLRSDAPHDLAQLDTWDKVRERVSAEDIAPSAEDRYELDLVVENLRGGPDVWDIDLLVQGGEVARDVAYALRMKSVVTALAPGSPLDDLDEALRGAANGGISGFFARRRLRKIGAQQAAIGWRTIIGKISAAVDWRD